MLSWLYSQGKTETHRLENNYFERKVTIHEQNDNYV